MINTIKKIFTTEDGKKLLANFTSLSILQGANYILPLITLPYLVRVLGPEKFGLVAFAQSFIAYFNIFTDYGFNLSATKEISIHRNNSDKLSEIFNSVMIIKIFLMIISIIIVSIIVFIIKKFRFDWEIYFLSFGMVIGQVLFPVWFFQGVEKMKYITILNIIAKLIFTILIFIFILEKSDYIYVPFINSMGFIVAGIISLIIIFKNFNITIKYPGSHNIKHQFTEGWHIFISTLAISLYTVSNTFILGLLTNNTIVGYYVAVDKIIKAIQGIQNPISQTIYPHISKLVSESKEKGLTFIRWVALFSGVLNLSMSIALFIFASFIVHILLGNQYEESIILLKILSFLPLIIGLSNIFGIQTMLTFDYKKAFSIILIFAGLINISLAFILVPFFQHIGISVAVLITECFVTLTMFIYLQSKDIKILRFNHV